MSIPTEYHAVILGDEQEILAQARRIRSTLSERGWAYLDPEEEFAQGFLIGYRTFVVHHSREKEQERNDLEEQGATRVSPFST